MSWLRRLVAGISSMRLGFDPRKVHVGFMWTEWHREVRLSEYGGFSLSPQFHLRSIFINPLALELDIEKVAHHLSKSEYFTNQKKVTL